MRLSDISLFSLYLTGLCTRNSVFILRQELGFETRYFKFILYKVQTHSTSNELQQAYRTSCQHSDLAASRTTEKLFNFRQTQGFSGSPGEFCRFGIAKSFPWGKVLKQEADNSLPKWRYTFPSPYTFMVSCIIKHEDKLHLTSVSQKAAGANMILAHVGFPNLISHPQARQHVPHIQSH